MKFIYHIFIIYLFIIAQTTFIEKYNIFGIKPNLLLILITSISLFNEKTISTIIGFFIGFVYDIVSSKVIGLNALFFMYMAITYSETSKIIKKNFLINTIYIFIFTFFYNIFNIAVLSMFNIKKFNIRFSISILIECLYNSLINIIFYILNKKIFCLTNNPKLNKKEALF
ncbi:MAG: rod shape-determining protein MreD [Clostridiales bacterium]|jgi:rod shape-determining protein MreD|nr:rod shape-determining protein MreD [Clostridiales bacterium]